MLSTQVNGFPISRDPPEGGTWMARSDHPSSITSQRFPISRDPPEGGTSHRFGVGPEPQTWSFQFLGIPPKGEHVIVGDTSELIVVSNF